MPALSPRAQRAHRRALTPADATTRRSLASRDARTPQSMADAPPQPARAASKEQQLSIEEQQIIAEIQELQRHLRDESPRATMTTKNWSCRRRRRTPSDEF